MARNNQRLTRSQVEEELTWKLEDLFATPDAWEAELETIQEKVPSVTQYKGKLKDGSGALLACLNAQEALFERVIRLGTYASLRSAEDGTNPENQGNSARVASVMSGISAALSFIKSEILELEDGMVERYLQDEPELATFRKNLEDILKTKPHKLSAETEEVLAALSEVHDAPYMIYQRSKASDMQFEPIQDRSGQEYPVSFATYEDKFESSKDTYLRRQAYTSFSNTLHKYQNTYAATYATEVKKQVVTAKLRDYESVTHMLLEPHDVTLEMHYNLLDIIQTELSPHMQRLARLKKRVLGLDTMLFCDLKAPLDPEFEPETSYDEASGLILEALGALGPEYSEFMAKGLHERRVDRADNVGKSTGAFCASPYGVHPFILLTWTDTMRSAFMLAHELGHAGHFSLANKYQRLSNTRPSMYFVEAPSTMNELLLGEHIMANTSDPRMKRWVILQCLGTYYHNYVTHLLEAELQRRVYTLAEAGKPITATVLADQKGEALNSFWGDTVQIDDGARLTWMRQPHYYMGLYPYTYSGGLTAATACAQLIREQGKPAVDNWLAALKAGGSQPPLDLLKLAGVDMSSPEPIRKAVAYVGTLVDELEESFKN